jgi:hypothetical protein
MDEWIEVFRVGRWTDSAGNTRTWTGGDLDRIVASTRRNLAVPGKEPPVVIGHPETDAPAWGWVDAIERRGLGLWVHFRDLVPEFVDMVRRRMFPNRSVAIGPDAALVHVGFLGAVPPAVKGLTPIALASAESLAVIEFAALKEERMTFVEKLRQFLGLADELGVKVDLPDKLKPADAPKTFIEADLTAARVESEARGRKAAEDAVAAERARERRAVREAQIATFCADLKTKGHLLPAWEQAGLRGFLLDLAGREDVVAFAEGADKLTPLAWMQAFLEGLPKAVTFGEVAKPEKKAPATTLTATQRDINRQLGVPDELVAKFSTQN